MCSSLTPKENDTASGCKRCASLMRCRASSCWKTLIIWGRATSMSVFNEVYVWPWASIRLSAQHQVCHVPGARRRASKLCHRRCGLCTHVHTCTHERLRGQGVQSLRPPHLPASSDTSTPAACRAAVPLRFMVSRYARGQSLAGRRGSSARCSTTSTCQPCLQHSAAGLKGLDRAKFSACSRVSRSRVATWPAGWQPEPPRGLRP